ncbi:MAG: tetratricopeptide repeat protein, partial [Planctomycetota bacterium]
INDADNDAAVGAIDLLIAARADDRQLSDLARDLAAVAADAPRLYELQDLVARIALLAGQWQIAYEAADVSARFNPTRIEPARFAAEAKANAGAWEEVIELARRWEQRSISAGVDPLPAVLLRARARLAQNQASRTLALLRAYRQQMNDEPQQYAEVIAVYSEALLRRNSGAEALPLLEPLLAEQPFARRLYVQIVSGQWPDVQDAQAKLELVGPMMISGEPAERVLLAKAWKQLEDRGAEPERFAELLADAAAQLLASDEPASDGLFVETAMLGTTLLDPADLQRLYERALEINPDNPIALNNLAMQLLDVGDPAALNRALAHAEKVAAMDEHPAHAYFLDTLASVQVARDELSAAARTLYEATQVDPRNPRWYAHLAEVQLAQDLRDAAASNYREARRLADSLRTIEPETQAALERLEAEFQ